MAYLSSEEIEQQHMQAMGSSLGPVYHLLYNDVMWLHAKWQQYRKLVGESRDRVELLNRAAGFFFFIVQDVLWNDVLLHLARLVDPPTSLGRIDKTNLTLRALPAFLSDSSLALKVNESVEEVWAACAFAVDWRNRRIAHRDLALALESVGSEPLTPASRAIVEAALKSIRTTLGLVHGHYLHMDPGFERFTPPGSDADAVLVHLQRSQEHEKCPR
jgi:hypothetical protein